MTTPEHLRYTDQHEWLADADGVATIGVTAYAADSLGDVVYVELPEVGRQVAEGDACGEIESTKSVSELFAPVSGEVVAVNEAVAETPDLVNTDPFGDGWLIRVRHDGLPDLLDAQAYRKMTEEA
jgi:glycine cleavage system H protein